MNTTHIRTMLVTGILAALLGTATTAAALPRVFLTIPTAPPGGTAIADSPKFKGGYGSSFNGTTGMSKIEGKLTIRNVKLTVEKWAIH